MEDLDPDSFRGDGDLGVNYSVSSISNRKYFRRSFVDATILLGAINGIYGVVNSIGDVIGNYIARENVKPKIGRNLKRELKGLEYIEAKAIESRKACIERER